MSASAVVWDMDGTLLDSSVVVPAAFAAAVHELGGPALDAAEVIAAYPLGTPEVILARLAGRAVTTEDMEAYYRRLEGVSVQPYAGVADALEALRTRGQPVAVFTGASSRAAALLLAAAGLAVDVLVGGDHVQRPKPAPDGLLLAASRLGVGPGDLAYVGDSPSDMRAAKAAGSHAAAAAWGHQYDPAEPADSVLLTPAQALDLLD
jgi:phosphoglycolate phosphatase